MYLKIKKLQKVNTCRGMDLKSMKPEKHARFGSWPKHEDLHLAFPGMVQEDVQQRMRKWVIPG